jgi:hypothetical protein
MKTNFRISVNNGVNRILFELKDLECEVIDKEAVWLLSNSILNELDNLNNTNKELKELGYKGNFFKFTLGRKCVLSIEAVTETENFTLIKNLEFSFGKLANLNDPEKGLRVILGATVNANNTLAIC